MMVQPEDEEVGHGREGGLGRAERSRHEIPRCSSSSASRRAAFQDEDYEQLIALAWRHQFDDDRTKFKRELRELQAHVTQRILDLLELSK